MKTIIKISFWLSFLLASFGFFVESAEGATKDSDFSNSYLQKIKRIKVKNVSDLKDLVPFENISVIQKRFLPKTYRGEFNLSLSAIANNHFFYSLGGGSHLGVFLREDHGFGVEVYGMFNTLKEVSKELRDRRKILPYNHIASKVYTGAYYKWSPVFGKFAVLDKKITYFDMFFTFGAGLTQVISGISKTDKARAKRDLAEIDTTKEWLPTGSLGIGQVFALSKDVGVSWDIKWNTYLYKLKGGSGKNFHNDIIMVFGLNYYFPGATYR